MEGRDDTPENSFLAALRVHALCLVASSVICVSGFGLLREFPLKADCPNDVTLEMSSNVTDSSLWHAMKTLLPIVSRLAGSLTLVSGCEAA